ncbi:MAG: AAA family ATPase [Reyranellaceae bacterium]
MAAPELLILAGPNGAGKTTFAYAQLRDRIDAGLFLNADETARELAPDNVESAAFAAARALLERRRQLLRARQSFVVETTLATRTLAGAIRDAVEAGFVSRLYFLFVSSASLCQFRVKLRVIKGGHNIPDDVVHRRHAAGLQLLPAYTSICDAVEIYHADETPVLIASKAERRLEVRDRPRFALLQAAIEIAGGEPLVA